MGRDRLPRHHEGDGWENTLDDEDGDGVGGLEFLGPVLDTLDVLVRVLGKGDDDLEHGDRQAADDPHDPDDQGLDPCLAVIGPIHGLSICCSIGPPIDLVPVLVHDREVSINGNDRDGSRRDTDSDSLSHAKRDR